MSDIAEDTWQKEIEDARAALHKQFSELQCLRCREDKFHLRMWHDASLVPGIADASNNRVIELICKNCGFLEKHVVNLLAAAKPS